MSPAEDASDTDAAKRRKRRREWGKVLNLSVVGMVFPVALLMGYFAGRWIGGLFGAERVGSLIGLFVGLGAGFRNLFVMIDRYGGKRDGEPPA